MSTTKEQYVVRSSMHAAMEAILHFSDPEVIACCRPKIPKAGKSIETSKKEQWLYDRLMCLHRFAKEALERDERETNPN